MTTGDALKRAATTKATPLKELARLRGVTRQAILRLIRKKRFRVLEIADKIFLNRREVKAYKIKPSGRPRKAKKKTKR